MEKKNTKNLQSDVLRSLLGDIDNERALVLVVHGYLELAVARIIDKHCKNAERITSDTRGYPFSVRIILLHELGLLTDQLFHSLDRFRKIRNQAAHEPYFTVTKDQLRYISEHYERDLNRDKLDPDVLPMSHNLRTVGIFLVGNIFKEHPTVIEESFTPEEWHDLNQNTEQSRSGGT